MRTLLIAGVILLLPDRAFAWGPQGHQTIAFIAERHLTAAAIAAVHDLLDSASMAEVSLWADDIKRTQRPETRPWHYVSIPDASPGFEERRDCPGRACVVLQIEEFSAQLKDPLATRVQKIEALKFLIHFVADLHQPLHCEDHADTLSHDLPVLYPGLGQTDFHVVWDTGVVQTDMRGRGARAYAAKLNAAATANREAWSRGSPEEWASEAHHIAQQIYLELRDLHARPLALTEDYGIEHAGIVEGQLERAGIRLAAILDDALERPAHGPTAR